MNYQAFYNKKTYELEADNLYHAKTKAIIHFDPPLFKRHMVHVTPTDTPMSTQHVGG